ncbi:MAG: PASTA domain-containing protein [Clostridia bacterium]|nr:PASTA domain-containing protein [Clostridia bacterium]
MSKWERAEKMAAKTDFILRKRAKVMVALLCAGLAVVNIYSLPKIVFAKGEEYREAARMIQLGTTTLPALRGTIYDANMTVLASSSYAWNLCISPNVIKTDETREDIVNTLSGMLSIDKDKLHDIVYDKDDAYEVIKRKMTAEEKNEVADYIAAKGEQYKHGDYTGILYFETSSNRYYPGGSLASCVLGYIDSDGIGRSGLEASYEEELSGTDGRIISAKNGVQGNVESDYESIIKAEDGVGVVSTIHSSIQYYLEKAMEQGTADAKAAGVYGIVQDVNTGAILAMASMPDFDPNNAYTVADAKTQKSLKKIKDNDKYNNARLDALYTQWRNDAVSYCYEPGSVFKSCTLATGLDVDAFDESESYCCVGFYNIAGNRIGCVNTYGHGTQSLEQGLMNSCNPFFIHLGQKIGREDYYKYFKAFGFTEKTGIDLPAEYVPAAGINYHTEDDFSVANLASYSFGQTFKVSPIQMITGISAIANGGHLMKPYVVSATVDSEGNILSATEPVEKRQVISESTSRRVRKMMEQVVENGTGKNAYIAGYHVAGKTATSQKLDAKQDNLYLASFACYAPADDPKVAVLVVVDEPKGEYHGGSMVAAPIAREVMEQTLAYLNVEPDYSDEELAGLSSTAPDLTGRTVSNAKQMAANQGFVVRVVGDGDKVISQMPSALTSIPVNGVIVIYTEETTDKETVEVPDFRGKTVSEVNNVGVNAGLNIEFSGPSLLEGGTVAYKQSISSGTKVEAGSTVTVYFHSTSDTED